VQCQQVVCFYNTGLCSHNTLTHDSFSRKNQNLALRSASVFANTQKVHRPRRIVVFPQQKYSMKCVLNWIPLRNRVRLRNTQPHLKNAIFLCKLKYGQFRRWGQKNRHTEVLAPKLLPHAQNSSPHQFSCRFHKLTRRVKYPYLLILL